MGNIGTIRTIDSRHVLHGVEIRSPIIRNCTGIKKVGLVEFFHVRGIASKQIGVGEVLLHHLAHLLLALRESMGVRKY
jgi:hypothetical protein